MTYPLRMNELNEVDVLQHWYSILPIGKDAIFSEGGWMLGYINSMNSRPAPTLATVSEVQAVSTISSSSNMGIPCLTN